MQDLEEATGSSYSRIKRNLEKLLSEEKIICVEKGKKCYPIFKQNT